MAQPLEADWPECSELIGIMESREISTLEKYGGIQGLYAKLHTSPQGLNSQTINEHTRLEKYFPHF